MGLLVVAFLWLNFGEIKMFPGLLVYKKTGFVLGKPWWVIVLRR